MTKGLKESLNGDYECEICGSPHHINEPHQCNPIEHECDRPNNGTEVFGSLEHEEVCNVCGEEDCPRGAKCSYFTPKYTEGPKQVNRITREEASDLCMMEALGGNLGRERRKKLKELFDYIEHLEANQKD